MPIPQGLDRCVAVVVYEGVGRQLVTRIKYHGSAAGLGWMASALAQRVGRPGVEVVTWVPTTPQRRRQRGYDQAELLARAVAREMHLPCRRLVGNRGTGSQTGRSRAQRLAGPAMDPVAPAPARVLVVDDVVTTGASLGATAAAVRRAGGREVWGAALACTRSGTPGRGRG